MCIYEGTCPASWDFTATIGKAIRHCTQWQIIVMSFLNVALIIDRCGIVFLACPFIPPSVLFL